MWSSINNKTMSTDEVPIVDQFLCLDKLGLLAKYS